MNLGSLHAYLGALLEAGVDASLPMTCLVDGWPQEITDVVRLKGKFHADPSPKMIAFKIKEGSVLTLIPIGEDISLPLNPTEDGRPATHQEETLPVDPPYPE